MARRQMAGREGLLLSTVARASGTTGCGTSIGSGQPGVTDRVGSPAARGGNIHPPEKDLCQSVALPDPYEHAANAFWSLFWRGAGHICGADHSLSGEQRDRTVSHQA